MLDAFLRSLAVRRKRLWGCLKTGQRQKCDYFRASDETSGSVAVTGSGKGEL